MVSPSHSVWSSPIGVITATPAWSTLVASSAPPSPTSTTATSTGASANVGERQRGGHVEVGQRLVDRWSTSSASGSTSRYIATKRSSLTGSPSRLIRSRTVSRCGLV